MNSRNRRRSLGAALSHMVACGAALALTAAVAPPALQQMRGRMRVVSCANNLRVCNQAFNVYAGEFGGAWIAPWDMNVPAGQPSATPYQWPFTMVHYVSGGHITDGKAVYWQPDGWWNPEGYRGGAGSYPLCNSPADAPQLQCAEVVARGREENVFWYGCTSYSYAIMNRYDEGSNSYRSAVAFYPIPDFMTHPATTINLSDLSGLITESTYNVWSTYQGQNPSDPHDGKSNYVFCDGHVELLSVQETTARMWQDQWRAEDDEAIEAAQAGGVE